MPQKTYKKTYKKAPKQTFAKAVKAVVNKIAETKQHSTDPGYTNLFPGTLTTWNITNGLTQGNNTSQRDGDKIYIKTLRLSSQMNNYSLAGAVVNGTVFYRIIIFRGKYDYSFSSYPASEVFESNAGAVPVNNLTARLDTNQITPLYDRVVRLDQNDTNQQCAMHILKTIRVNKNFYFKDDDNYGKVSNLYLGVVPLTQTGLGNPTIQSNCSFTFTDL